MKRLGDYELLRKIGVGGMAEVWMGRRAAMAGASKAVAIKLLARDLLNDPAYRQMFIEEARLSMLLTNSNVVQVFDVGEIDGECFMVMEWVDGLNLSELVRQLLGAGESLSVAVAAHVAGEILRALAYAHGLHHEGSKATVVHRDVSPQNVLVSVSGEVKLADFGIARLSREETSGLHVKGKLRYMAPEQLRGRSREPTVDLYAVGAIFHELLEGQRFRQLRDEGDLYSVVLSGEYLPLTVAVPPELARLHAGLLHPDPKLRIQSADEALELLHAWPGYRNSSTELGRLVRRWIGVEGPRSGILSNEIVAAAQGQGPRAGQGQGSPLATNVSAAETLDAPTRALAGSGGAGTTSGPTVIESGPHADRGATETRTARVPPERESTAMLAGPAAPAAQGTASLMLIVVALTLAVSFGVFGLGFPLGWWSSGADEAKAAEVPTLAEEAQGQATEAADPSGESSGTTAPDLGGSQVAIQVAIEDEAEMGDDAILPDLPPPPVDRAPVDRTPVDRTPADVTFSVGNMGHVWVKVGGKVLSLEPVADIKLKPGSHRVQLRQDDQGAWISAGRITVKAGNSYRVVMASPATLKLTEL